MFNLLKEYVHACPSLRHKNVAYIISAEQGPWSLTVYQQARTFFPVVSADRLQEIRCKCANPSGREV